MTKETMIRLLTQAAIWGSSFSFIKMALEGLASIFRRALVDDGFGGAGAVWG